jgi:hypothetical protein
MVGQARKTRRRVAWAGTAVVLGGGINLLQQNVGGAHLRAGVLALITGIIVVVTTLVSALQERRTHSDAIEKLEEALDAMLACWPPRSASQITAYDVGVHPDLADVGAAPPYVARDRDSEVEAALRETGIAVVFGPAAAGKSRSAFEAVKRVAPDAAMIIPASGEGLGKVMLQARSLPLLEQPTVLWLDGLERFSETLDTDRIEALVHPRPHRGWMRRIRRTPVEPHRMTVVATLRSDDLDRLLGDGADASHETRRFLAHARGIRLDDRLSDDERSRFEETHGRQPAGPTVAEAFPRRWSEGWEKATSHEPAREEGGYRLPVWPVVLGGALAVLGVLLVRQVDDGGWTDPPPLKTQVRELADSVRSCQRLDAYPKDGRGLGERDVLVAIVHGAGCNMSDEVRFYRQKSKRLKQISALAPADPAQVQSFSCIGESKEDPCHVLLAGRSSVIVGAFMDENTRKELPLVVSFGGDEELGLSALSPPGNRQQVTVRLRVGTSAPGGAGCEQSQGCLRGRPAATTGILAAAADRPPILLAGYASGGIAAEVPKALKVRAWRLKVPPEGAPEAQRSRDCLVLIDGTPAALRRRVGPGEDPRSVLFASATPKGSQIMC